ncbi:hypothetical protein [Thermaerobacillus caldiproteolyticus]|uniref:hypothetical protein n=1 Tax=Thermaerobacillus caldiproteolyticus TaxID=247480 RepID=UPI001889F450|nr:hypothetical protein [Anoxybacillus caldiproteolyticus]QPA33430.1 hypothetical protein ISX45_19105 [Anoxybacillus caldiproteolyticus]
MSSLMTSIGLIDTLTEKIKQWVTQYRLETTHRGVRKPPQVRQQFLPPKKRKEEQEIPDYPHVIVRYVRERIKDGTNLVQIHIIAGTVCDDHEVGFRDVLNVLTRIKNEMLKQPTFGAFQIEEEGLSIDIPEEQYAPEWVGYIVAEYIIPKVQNEGGLPYVSQI